MDENTLETLADSISMVFEIDAENASAAIYDDIMSSSLFICEVPKDADLTTSTNSRNKLLIGGAALGIGVVAAAIVIAVRKKRKSQNGGLR